MRLFVIVAAVSVLSVSSAIAQSFEASVHFASSQWSEFEGSDFGVGGRFTWKPTSLVGLDADLSWYPGDFPPDRVSFSGARIEGLFGVTAGPRLGRIRPFVKVAGGFLEVNDPPAAIVCIAIFPPPLACQMAAGPTLQAWEIGGGIEVSATDATFLRVDVADRLLKYPGPTLDEDFQLRDEGFWGHGLKLTLAAGVRF